MKPKSFFRYIPSFLILFLPIFASAAEPYATMGDKSITSDNLNAKSKGMFFRAEAEYYEAKKRALDAFFLDYLLEEEAKKLKTTPAELLKNQVESKVRVTDSDVEKYYNEVKESMDKQGKGSQIPPLDKVSAQIKGGLVRQKGEERRQQYFDELKAKYRVVYNLVPPKMEISEGNLPPRGAPRAPVSVVMFSDYQCPFCKKVVPTLEQVVKEFPGKVKISFRDYPLPMHKRAMPAALAARCAAEQGKFWNYHDKLFSESKNADEDFYKYANDVGLNSEKFKSCYTSEKYKADVEKDVEEASAVGVTGTPAFFINGTPLAGSASIDRFRQMIRGELAKARPQKMSQETIMP